MTSDRIVTRSSRWGWLSDFIFQGYSGDSLGLFRIYFAVGMLVYHATQIAPLLEIDPFGATFYYTDPIWYFRLMGIVAHHPWLTDVALILLFASTVTLALGYRTRTSIVMMFVMIAYVQGVRDSFDGDVHHRYVVPANLLIFLFFSRCGDVLSFDSRASGFPNALKEWESSWPLRAAQIYITFYYFFAGVAKLRVAGWAWVGDGGQVQIKLIERSMRYGLTDAGAAVSMKFSYALAQQPALLVTFVWIVIAFEMLSPLILFTRSVWMRIAFVLFATAFHIGNFVLLSVMFVFYPFLLLVYFDLAKIYAWLASRFGLPALAPAAASPSRAADEVGSGPMEVGKPAL